MLRNQFGPAKRHEHWKLWVPIIEHLSQGKLCQTNMLKLLDSVKYRYSFPLNLDNGLRICYILIPMCIQSYCQSMMKGCFIESPIWNEWYFDYNFQKVIGYLGFLSAPHFVTEICLQLDLQISRNTFNRSQRATAEQQKISFEMHVGVRRKLNYMTMSKVGETMQNLCPAWMFVGIKEAMKWLE